MPTRVTATAPATNWSTSASPKTTGTFDVQAGDLIVVKADAANGGTHATVTPSASGGSVTWTLRVAVGTGTSNCGAFLWTGAVGATATGITVTLASPTTNAGTVWGFTATVWRDHGGVGNTFSAVSGSVVAASVAVTCSAGSAVDGILADWWCSASGSRVWRTINGAAITEATHYFDAYSHVVYDGYRTDVGTAGSKDFGLTAPNTKHSVAGVEILAGGGAPAGQGSGAGTLTFSGSAAGKRVAEGTGSGSVALSGTGAGKRAPKGSTSGTLAWTGTGAGKRTPRGSGAGTIAFTGAGSGTVARRGTGNGTLTTVGTSTGKRTPKASGTSSLSFTGSAVGSAPSVDTAEGTGSGALAWAGAGTGRRTPKGTGSGTVAYAGSGVGSAPSVDAATGTGAGVVAWVGTAAGRRQAQGVGAGHLEVAGAAVGFTVRRGTGSGTLAFTGTATTLLPPKLSVAAPLPARHRAGQPLPGRHTAGTPTAARYRTGGTP